MKKISLFTAIIIFFNVSLYSQNISVPVLRTIDPAKLSGHITKGIINDSDKVVAIHKWITKNIKYDVKKWLNFNYDPVPLNKVLKKRKANCLGYSELFNELCKNAGIKSVKINGYVKDMNVDIVDNFYLDEHAWNAVFLNNRWKFVDETWDAGYIKFSKLTIWGRFVKFITAGKVVIIKYKPHFVKDPNNFYFLKSDIYYKRDHLPLNPLWQTSSPKLTLTQFKADSSYFLGLPPVLYDGRSYDITYDHERLIYYSSNDNFKFIEDGISGNKFNSRNHYCLANSYFLMGKNEASKLDLDAINKVDQDEICDSVIICAQKALIEYDSNNVFLRQQKNELLANNIVKKNILIHQNKKLIRSTKFTLRNLSNGIALSKKNIKYAKRIVKTYRKKLNNLKKNKSFYVKKQAVTPATLDSLNFYYQVLFTGDSINLKKDSIKSYFNLQNNFYKKIRKDFASYSIGTIRSLSTENLLKMVRFEYYDDCDYEVRTLKDTLMEEKFDNDLLLFSDSIFKIKILYYELKDIRRNIYAHAGFYKEKARSLTQLKGASVTPGNLEEQYTQNIQRMEQDVKSFADTIKVWIKRYNELKHYCRKQKTITKRELKSYFDEKATEYGFYAVRGRYIKHHYAALISNNKFHLKQASDLKRLAEKFKKKLNK